MDELSKCRQLFSPPEDTLSYIVEVLRPLLCLVTTFICYRVFRCYQKEDEEEEAQLKILASKRSKARELMMSASTKVLVYGGEYNIALAQ